MVQEVKYPQVKVKLVGEDGNAFSILGRVTRAMREAGLSEGQRNEFFKQATSGDYDKLLLTVMEFVTVDDDDTEEEDPQLWGDMEEEEEGDYVEEE